MKFYRKTEQHLFNGTFADEKLIYICSTYYFVDFCKNNTYHNTKNAAHVHDSSYKEFYLNGKCYGTNNDFTKNLWRKFVKMQVFL